METFYLICAGLGGTVIALQFLASAVGFHLESDHDLDHETDHDHDSAHGSFLGLLTLRSVSAAIAFFGLAGLSANSLGASPLGTLGAAVLVPMVVTAVLAATGFFSDPVVPAPVLNVGYLVIGAQVGLKFTRETLRVDRGDGRWFLRWPIGAATGRFARHEGHFDPGQRIANLVFAGSFGTLVVSGIALTTLSAGSTYATMVRIHRGATYVLTVTVAVHVLVALGVLPGYRGVWRTIHWGGKVPTTVVRRLWPTRAPTPDEPER